MSETKTKTETPKVWSHWFVSSVLHWETGTDLAKVLATMTKRNKASKIFRGPADMCIYFVPLPEDAEYSINNYMPEVEGVRFVGHVNLANADPLFNGVLTIEA